MTNKEAAEGKVLPCPNPFALCQGGGLNNSHQGSGLFRIVCACGIRGPLGRDEAEAIAAWNRRNTRHPAAQEGGEALAKAVDDFKIQLAWAERDPNGAEKDLLNALAAYRALAAPADGEGKL